MARLAPAALVLGVALLLGGCFRPMYASVSPSGAPLADAMAGVTINLVDGRVGQQVRNNLDFGLTGGGERKPARYVMDLSVNSTRASSIIDVQTNEPQIDTVTVTAIFTLTPIGSETPALTGRNIASKSYDRTLQRFAALRAARDAENSAAELIADQIRTRIAIFLAEHP